MADVQGFMTLEAVSGHLRHSSTNAHASSNGDGCGKAVQAFLAKGYATLKRSTPFVGAATVHVSHGIIAANSAGFLASVSYTEGHGFFSLSHHSSAFFAIFGTRHLILSVSNYWAAVLSGAEADFATVSRSKRLNAGTSERIELAAPKRLAQAVSFIFSAHSREAISDSSKIKNATT